MRNSILPRVLLLVLAAAPSAAGESATAFELELLKDSVIMGSCVSVFVAGNLLRLNASAPQGLSDLAGTGSRVLITEYTKAADTASDAFQYASFALPALLAVDFSFPTVLTTGVMYAESVLLAIGIKDSLKGLLPRFRPFMYGDQPPQALLEDSDRYFSFPSGHTTMAFTGASFLTYVFLTGYPGSKLRIPVIAGSFLLATTTAALRVLSGQHFVTDVLAGAAIGAACGLVVPLIHRVRQMDDDPR